MQPAKKSSSLASTPSSLRSSVAPARSSSPIAKDRHTLLATACGADDTKCICINNAIFKHDSGWATAGVGKRALNPCNMRPPKLWKPSVSFEIMPVVQVIDGKKVTTYFAKFKTLEDGITACVELYKRHYASLPPAKLVALWTDNGGQGAYQSAVNSCFI